VSCEPEKVTALVDGALDAPETERIAAHVEAWGELLCTAAGLPPVPDGVAPMPSRRGQRGGGRRGAGR